MIKKRTILLGGFGGPGGGGGGGGGGGAGGGGFGPCPPCPSGGGGNCPGPNPYICSEDQACNICNSLVPPDPGPYCCPPIEGPGCDPGRPKFPNIGGGGGGTSNPPTSN